MERKLMQLETNSRRNCKLGKLISTKSSSALIFEALVYKLLITLTYKGSLSENLEACVKLAC